MIQIIGNVGNQGYALPMVSAYPLDVNSQNLLAWNPVAQALDYVPYVGNALGDFTVARDLTVTRNATVGGNLTLTGVASILTVPTGGQLKVDNIAVNAAANIAISALVSSGNITGTAFKVAANQVVGARIPGWTAATGTATRTTFATGAVTLPQLAEHVKALIDDLIAHGLIGP